MPSEITGKVMMSRAVIRGFVSRFTTVTSLASAASMVASLMDAAAAVGCPPPPKARATSAAFTWGRVLRATR